MQIIVIVLIVYGTLWVIGNLTADLGTWSRRRALEDYKELHKKGYYAPDNRD